MLEYLILSHLTNILKLGKKHNRTGSQKRKRRRIIQNKDMRLILAIAIMA